MRIAARITAVLSAALGICTLSFASPGPGIDAVLSTVARDYCAHSRRGFLSLNPKVATIKDVPESRAMLRGFFGDPDLVDAFFSQNTEDIRLPKGGRYACYQLSEYGELALSLPVFSKSNDTAFVYLADNCPGLCGHGALYVLHLTGRRWSIARRIPLWVS